MISKWHWLLLQLTRRLWVRASLFAILGVLTALGAVAFEHMLPWPLPVDIGADAVGGILNILASSMLAVTTFSLGVMVSAYSAATSNVSPRATKLLMQDSTTQNALAAFIGSFLFSLVGIVTLAAGAYGDRGRVILYIVTLVVIGLVVFTILRWIDHLSRLGRVGETSKRVEAAAMAAMKARAAAPNLGAQPMRDPPDAARRIAATEIGYVQHVDVGALEEAAAAAEGRVYLGAAPGAFVYPSAALAWIEGDIDEAIVRDAFTIDAERTFDQDPRFGVSVLSEIAQRALSPGINDPGTAIDILSRQVRVLAVWAQREQTADEVLCARVFAPALAAEDLIEDAFRAIARDGAGVVEVQMRLQKALAALAPLGDAAFKAAVRRQSQAAVAYANEVLKLQQDRERVAEAARAVEAQCAGA